eukprot:gene51593-biopygen22260
MWADASGDQFDWSRGSGGTPSGSTGPSGAHNGEYTSGGRANGDTAMLQALAQNADALSLWYHMYGSAIGELRVEASDAGAGQWSTVWSRNGDQGNSWQSATHIALGCTPPCDVRIAAVRASSFQGDIAIDDTDSLSNRCSSQTDTCTHVFPEHECAHVFPEHETQHCADGCSPAIDKFANL